MDTKDFKTYLNEAKTKITSVEACITEAHALAENADKDIKKMLEILDVLDNN